MASSLDESTSAFGALTDKTEITQLGNCLKDAFRTFGNENGSVFPDRLSSADLRQRIVDIAVETSTGQFTLGRDELMRIVDGLVAKHHARLNYTAASKIWQDVVVDPVEGPWKLR